MRMIVKSFVVVAFFASIQVIAQPTPSQVAQKRETVYQDVFKNILGHIRDGSIVNGDTMDPYTISDALAEIFAFEKPGSENLDFKAQSYLQSYEYFTKRLGEDVSRQVKELAPRFSQLETYLIGPFRMYSSLKLGDDLGGHPLYQTKKVALWKNADALVTAPALEILEQWKQGGKKGLPAFKDISFVRNLDPKAWRPYANDWADAIDHALERGQVPSAWLYKAEDFKRILLEAPDVPRPQIFVRALEEINKGNSFSLGDAVRGVVSDTRYPESLRKEVAASLGEALKDPLKREAFLKTQAEKFGKAENYGNVFALLPSLPLRNELSHVLPDAEALSIEKAYAEGWRKKLEEVFIRQVGELKLKDVSPVDLLVASGLGNVETLNTMIEQKLLTMAEVNHAFQKISSTPELKQYVEKSLSIVNEKMSFYQLLGLFEKNMPTGSKAIENPALRDFLFTFRKQLRLDRENGTLDGKHFDIDGRQKAKFLDWVWQNHRSEADFLVELARPRDVFPNELIGLNDLQRNEVIHRMAKADPRLGALLAPEFRVLWEHFEAGNASAARAQLEAIIERHGANLAWEDRLPESMDGITATRRLAWLESVNEAILKDTSLMDRQRTTFVRARLNLNSAVKKRWAQWTEKGARSFEEKLAAYVHEERNMETLGPDAKARDARLRGLVAEARRDPDKQGRLEVELAACNLSFSGNL